MLTASVRLGGLYAEADVQQDRLLRSLGEQLGLLFQIADDILDVERSTEELGKTAGKDAEAAKLTYPGLFGLDESKLRLRQVHDQALGLAEKLPDGQMLSALISYLLRRRN